MMENSNFKICFVLDKSNMFKVSYELSYAIETLDRLLCKVTYAIC